MHPELPPSYLQASFLGGAGLLVVGMLLGRLVALPRFGAAVVRWIMTEDEITCG